MTGTSAIPAVMGRAAVNVTAVALGFVGVGQLVGFRVSGVVDDSSAAYLGTVWGLSFALGLFLIIMSRNHSDAYLAMVLEVGALIYLTGGLVVYLVALFDASNGWPTNGSMNVALSVAAVINMVGRGTLVFRSMLRWVLIFRADGRPARVMNWALRNHGHLKRRLGGRRQ